MYEIKLDIDGMACGMCESHINDAIRNKLSIKKVKSNHRKGTSIITSEESLSQADIEKVLDGTGYRIVGYDIKEK